MCALKAGNKITIVVLIFGTAMLTSLTAINDALALANTSTLAGAVELGNPFYVEHYQETVGRSETLNKSFTESFTGQGILNGTVNIRAEGNATQTIRNNETVYIQGDAKFVTENGDVALYNFEAIGNYSPDGTFEGRGAAFFGDGANGELSFLSDTVAIYKERVDGSGNGTFLMWHWK